MTTGPWLAKFKDGPCAGPLHDREFMVGPVAEVLCLTPDPDPKRQEFILVGWDSMPEPPWPAQVIYRLSSVGGLENRPVAYYQIEEVSET